MASPEDGENRLNNEQAFGIGVCARATGGAGLNIEVEKLELRSANSDSLAAGAITWRIWDCSEIGC